MMDGKTYIVRSLKYLVWLLLLFTLVFTLMLATGTSRRMPGAIWPNCSGRSGDG